MRFFILSSQTQTFSEYIADYSPFDIVELALMLLIYLFSAKLLAVITARMVSDN